MSPSITDWLMVGITVVYVVATIVICYANLKAAKSTREQTILMKQQFKDEQKMKLMPCLQIKHIPEQPPYINGTVFCNLFMYEDCITEADTQKISNIFYFRIQNVGHDVAKSITYEQCHDGILIREYQNIVSLMSKDIRYVKVEIAVIGKNRIIIQKQNL